MAEKNGPIRAGPKEGADELDAHRAPSKEKDDAQVRLQAREQIVPTRFPTKTALCVAMAVLSLWVPNLDWGPQEFRDEIAASGDLLDLAELARAITALFRRVFRRRE